MEPIRHIEHRIARSRRLPALVIALALAVLAGVVAFTTLQVRHRIREQIAGRDGELLYAMALMHYAQEVESGRDGDQLSAVLKSAEMRGVLGVRLFDVAGRFVDSVPPYVVEGDLIGGALESVQHLRPVIRFHPRVEAAELFYLDLSGPSNAALPLLEVNVPLHAHDGPLGGIAQFLVEGHSIAAEYALLDRHLALQSGIAFLSGGTILTIALAWAFRRLRRAHRMLADRTENLLKANQELALAARTSALGAVTAHLIHGLKNPLAGLQSFVTARGSLTEDGADWDQAVASTRRMQAMIAQVIGVLREEQSGTSYEITLREIEEIVRGRVQPVARKREVNFTAVVQVAAALPNRVANLVALILVNLAENAVHATPSGGNVTLTVCRPDDRLRFEVRDEGAGFPADTPLFMPCSSAKEDGTGIGLALSRQLANHLGAELTLASSTPAGCVFSLSLPPASTADPAGPERGRRSIAATGL